MVYNSGGLCICAIQSWKKNKEKQPYSDMLITAFQFRDWLSEVWINFEVQLNIMKKSARVLFVVLLGFGIFGLQSCKKKHEKCSAYDQVTPQK